MRYTCIEPLLSNTDTELQHFAGLQHGKKTKKMKTI